VPVQIEAVEEADDRADEEEDARRHDPHPLIGVVA